MSGTVATACPICGPVDVPAADITIRASVATMHATYWFRCPLCSKQVATNAVPGVVMLLLKAGAAVARTQPMDIDMPINPAPFSEEEVAAFLVELEALPTTDG